LAASLLVSDLLAPALAEAASAASLLSAVRSAALLAASDLASDLAASERADAASAASLLLMAAFLLGPWLLAGALLVGASGASSFAVTTESSASKPSAPLAAGSRGRADGRRSGGGGDHGHSWSELVGGDGS
jgi:hypothetical protein